MFISIVGHIKAAHSVRLMDAYDMFDYTIIGNQHVLSFGNNRGDTVSRAFTEYTKFRINANVISFDDVDDYEVTLHLYDRHDIL
jgi:hypothetical protein